jgi:hypothetical protein
MVMGRSQNPHAAHYVLREPGGTAERTEPPFWTHNFLERQTLASIFHLSESNASHYIDFLRQNSGKVLEGFPSVLAILADFILKTGKPIPMRAVLPTESRSIRSFERASKRRSRRALTISTATPNMRA